MLKEINEQPETIQKAYNYGGRINGNTIKLGGLDQILNITSYIEYIYLIGCGTSYNAALAGEIYLNELNKFVTVKCINACEFTENCLPNIKNYSTLMCIFLSQSGETLDVYNCLKICKNKQASILQVNAIFPIFLIHKIIFTIFFQNQCPVRYRETRYPLLMVINCAKI